MKSPIEKQLQLINNSIRFAPTISSKKEDNREENLNYLYFASIRERLAIHGEEQVRGMHRVGISYQEQIQNHILDFPSLIIKDLNKKTAKIKTEIREILYYFWYRVV